MTQFSNINLGSLQLTIEGLARLERELEKYYGERPSDNQLHIDAHLGNKTIAKIRNRQGCVSISSIQQLFDVCDLNLDETQDYEPCQQQPKPSKSKRQLTSSPPQPPAAQLANLLWNLDCRRQEDLFQQNLDQNSQALAVVIQASNRSIRLWLLKRLVRKLKNSENAKNFEVDMRSPYNRHLGLDAIWSGLAGELDTSATPQAVFQGLCTLCATQPIVIVVQSRHRFRDFNTQLWRDFWYPLVSQLPPFEYRLWRSRLLLCLMLEGSNDEPPFDVFTDKPSVSDFPDAPPILPDVKTICSDDVARWLFEDEVNHYLNQLLGAEGAQQVEADFLKWDDNPELVLEEICWTFQLRGIDDIIPYWQLGA